jgi:ParB family chromosome partitioning protein
MSSDKYNQYRGDLRALATAGDMLAFVTVHPEGQPTALYWVETEKLALTSHPLPAGGLSLLAADDSLWVGGSDNQVYQAPLEPGAPKARGPKLAEPPVALAPLAEERLAVASGKEVLVLARSSGKVKQKLELPEKVTALASDPTGQWLAAGTAKGNVAVFECETESTEFRLSDQAPLHDGAVTALLFEADELRFLSAGADQKLQSTHARGKLEAEDRGKGANHEQPITGMVAITADRFLTGSSDASLKSWPRAKGARPVTQKDGVAKVVAVAVVPVLGKPQAVAACEDNTIRFFHLDEEHKFGEPGDCLHGALDWAKNELAAADPRQREAALKTLAEWSDTASLELIAEQMNRDTDHSLRLTACKLLGESSNPRAARPLERGLNHRDEVVRVAAFEGLRRHAGPKDLRPLVLALKTDRADVGQLAVKALGDLAAKDDQALARLSEAINHKAAEVRPAVLAALEKVHDRKSPEASLIALGSTHADLRRRALVRLFERKLLQDPGVQGALRWRGEDGDPEVRRVAFLLSLYTRDKLIKTLRERDAELDRQLKELESGELPAMKDEVKPEAAPEATTDGAPAATAAEVVAEALPGGDLHSQLESVAQQHGVPVEDLEDELYGEGIDLDDPNVTLGSLATQIDEAIKRMRSSEEQS